jgi:hypothetical protein
VIQSLLHSHAPSLSLVILRIHKVLRIVVEHFRGGIVGRMHVLKVVVRSIPYIVGVGIGGVTGIRGGLDKAFTNSVDDINVCRVFQGLLSFFSLIEFEVTAQRQQTVTSGLMLRTDTTALN